MEQQLTPPTQEIIDVHCHCFADLGQSERINRALARLRQAGVCQLAVMGLVNPSLNEQQVWQLIPEGFDNQGPADFNEAEALLSLSRHHATMLFPMLDTRMLYAVPPEQISRLLGRGFRGIKGLYLADDANDLGVASVPAIFGISVEEYRRREWLNFAYAEGHDLPLLYHMDARRYGEEMRAILEDFPRLRINFPHFGIGRKAFSHILDRYANVFTDIAHMKPHIQHDPTGYANFIRHYQDQICFGTDALLYQPQIILDYIALIKGLKLSAEVEHKIFFKNPRKFLGNAKDRQI